MAIIQNHRRGKAVVHLTANVQHAITDFAVPNTAVETMDGLTVTKIFWTGPWTIARGANIIFQTANNSGVWDLAAYGIALTQDPTANLVVNTTSTGATIVIEVAKQSHTLTDD